MGLYRNGRRTPLPQLAVLLVLGISPSAKASETHQKRQTQNTTSADIQREHDKAAAVADAAIPGDSRPPLKWKGYPALQAGPELSAYALVDQVHTLSRTLDSYADAEPDRVEKALGMALPSDAEGRRRGVAGRIGSGTYTWAVWKRSPSSAGNSVQLMLEPASVCLSFDALKIPLLVDGFKMHVPAFGDDDRITFYKRVESSLTRYVAVSVDRRDAPTCGRTVMLELEPSDD